MKKHKSIFDMQFITAGISTTMVLFLLGLVVFFVLTANNFSVYIRENISFSAILDDGIKETSIIKLQESLNKKDYVKQTIYISKEQALKEQIEAMGTDPSEFLGHNPFNASIEIKLNAGYTNPDSIKWIERELMSNKSILDVCYPQNLLDSVNRNLQTENKRFSAWACCSAFAYLILADKQYHTSDHLFQKVSDTHYETGRCKLGIHTSPFHNQKSLDRNPFRSYG